MKKAKKGLAFLFAGGAVLFIATMYGITGPMPRDRPRSAAEAKAISAQHKWKRAEIALNKTKKECREAKWYDKGARCATIWIQEADVKAKKRDALRAWQS